MMSWKEAEKALHRRIWEPAMSPEQAPLCVPVTRVLRKPPGNKARPLTMLAW